MSENKKHTHHIIPIQIYLKVFAALMVLTVLTILAAEIDLPGSFNIILAMFIAIVKSTLVLMFFMHLYYDNKTNLLFFLGSVLFLIIFIAFTYFDIGFRDGIYKIEDKTPNSIIYKEGSIKDSHDSEHLSH